MEVKPVLSFLDAIDYTAICHLHRSFYLVVCSGDAMQQLDLLELVRALNLSFRRLELMGPRLERGRRRAQHRGGGKGRRGRVKQSAGSVAADRRQDTAAQNADGDAREDSESVDEHVADFERPARYQLLAELQSYAQQDHGEGRRDSERSALDGEERQDG